MLIYTTQHTESTVRSIAVDVGLTERATLAILRDLDNERLVERHRQGRRTTYVVHYERLVGMVAAGTRANAAVDAVVRALIAIPPEGCAASRRRQPPAPADRGERIGAWAFFANHMALLIAIARAPTPDGASWPCSSG